MLIIVCGLPGTGKSTLAKELGKKLNAVVLSTDFIRKKVIKRPMYTEDEKKLIYKIMLTTTEFLLKSDINCILDATFFKEYLRMSAKAIAKRLRKKFIIVECVMDEDKVRKRIRRRRGHSDADFDVYKKLRQEWENIRDEHIVADMNKSLSNVVSNVIKEIEHSAQQG